MNALFHGKKSLAGLKGIAMLCLLQLPLFAPSAYSQEQGKGTLDNRKVYYGIQLGFTENKVDLYYTLGGAAHAMEQGNHSFYTPGFRTAAIFDIRLGDYFSLRAMPGVSLFNCDWEPTTLSPSTSYTVESVCGDVPVDVKFHPFRMGNWEPYITSGLGYSFDFASQRKTSDNKTIGPLNAHNLNYTCGLGIDCYTRYLKIGVDLKAGFGLLSPNTGGSNHTEPFYFHSGPTFCLGFTFEA